MPECQATLGGEIASLCAAFDALVKAAERDPLITRAYARPHPQYIYAGMRLQRRLIVDMMRTLRASWRAAPSRPCRRRRRASRARRRAADTERYYRRRAHRARASASSCVKLIWDFVGTEFGGRQLQYEMFYSASQPVVNRRMFRSYDWSLRPKLMVERCLGEY